MRIEAYTSNATMELDAAILLYKGNGTLTASFHDVRRRAGENGEPTGPPTILPGNPLTQDTLSEIYRKLAGSQKQSRSLMPENVLCADAGRLIWYVPSHRRIMFFRPSDKKDKALASLNGKEVLHPTLLFVAESQSLYVFAIVGAGETRPTGKTPLCIAPYYNLWESGHMCAGSRLPKTCTPRDIPAFERGFFDTNFSHTNRNQLTKHPAGHLGLWQEMAKTGRAAPKVFPAKYLVPLKKKLEFTLNGKL